MTKFVRYHMEEWSALYEDGKLVQIGDHYLSDEYLSNYLEVDERFDQEDSVFAGQTHTRENALKNLRDVEEYNENKASAISLIDDEIDAKMNEIRELQKKRERL